MLLSNSLGNMVYNIHTYIHTQILTCMHKNTQKSLRAGSQFAGGVQKGINIVGLSVCEVIAVLHSTITSHLEPNLFKNSKVGEVKLPLVVLFFLFPVVASSFSSPAQHCWQLFINHDSYCSQLVWKLLGELSPAATAVGFCLIAHQICFKFCTHRHHFHSKALKGLCIFTNIQYKAEFCSQHI